jgi:cytochrome c-type biogenesis protein CcmH/NrfG
MAAKKTVSVDLAVIMAIGGLLVGFTAGMIIGKFLWERPLAGPPPVAGPPAAISPPGTALGSMAAEIRELRNIVDKNPENASAWVRLGNLYFDTDQFMEAIDAYTKSLALEPNEPDVITDRAIMYRRIGDFDRAVSELRRAAAMSPTHLNSLLNLGVVLRYDLNDVPGAIQAWKSYLARNPPADMAEKISKEIESLQAQGQ